MQSKTVPIEKRDAEPVKAVGVWVPLDDDCKLLDR